MGIQRLSVILPEEEQGKGGEEQQELESRSGEARAEEAGGAVEAPGQPSPRALGKSLPGDQGGSMRTRADMVFVTNART